MATADPGLSGSGFASTGLGGGGEGATLEEAPPLVRGPWESFSTQNGYQEGGSKKGEKMRSKKKAPGLPHGP